MWNGTGTVSVVSLGANQCTPLTSIHFLLEIWEILADKYDHWKVVP
jgi:hypothetical protein